MTSAARRSKSKPPFALLLSEQRNEPRSIEEHQKARSLWHSEKRANRQAGRCLLRPFVLPLFPRPVNFVIFISSTQQTKFSIIIAKLACPSTHTLTKKDMTNHYILKKELIFCFKWILVFSGGGATGIISIWGPKFAVPGLTAYPMQLWMDERIGKTSEQWDAQGERY